MLVYWKDQFVGKTHTLAELAMDLATQDVEQVRRLSHVSDLHVAILVLAVQLVSSGENARLLVAKLQPTLHTTKIGRAHV